MNKISGIYKIINAITGDFYIGSSKDVKQRWRSHKWPSAWKKHPNNRLYQDMKNYGTDKFVFEILEEVEPEQLKETEQQFIEKLQPTYNNYNAKGLDIERIKKSQKEYHKNYDKNERARKSHRKADKKYNNQLCFYNGEALTLCALASRFQRAGIEHYTLEAKKYLINN